MDASAREWNRIVAPSDRNEIAVTAPRRNRESSKRLPDTHLTYNEFRNVNYLNFVL